MQKVIYTIGIPASGKSSYVQGLAKKENAIILSTDDIRRELFGEETKQKKTNLVYRTLYERLNQLVSEGFSIIVDATNIEREKRETSLTRLNNLKKELKKICYYFDTPYEICLERNRERKRTVDERIMKKMRINLEIPLLGEGFDEIRLVHEPSGYAIKKDELIDIIKQEPDYHELFTQLIKIPFFHAIYRFNQENIHHQFLLCEHTYLVYQYVNENYYGEDKLVMQIAALCHDLGKPFCKKFKPSRNSHSYFGHENVSGQMVYHFLNELGFDEQFIREVTNIVQLHMLINYGGAEGETKIYHLVGPETLTKLYFFREADKFAK
jgi:predicted kinase